MSAHAAAAPRPAQGTLSPATRRLLFVLAWPMFVVLLDASAVALALPSMARAMGTDAATMSVALTTYLVSVAVCVPASGWLVDRYGPRNVLCGALAVFIIGALLCARTHTLGGVALARALQGVGGALTVPVGRMVILKAVATEEVASALSWQSPPGMLAMLVAPPLSGWVVTHLGWRWIFDLAVPPALIAMALIWQWVPSTPAPAGQRLDGRGLLLVGVALAGLMFGLESISHRLVPMWIIVLAVSLGSGAAVAYGWHMQRVDAPALDLRLVRLPCYGRVFTAALLYRTSCGALPFLLPMTLQLQLEWSPWEAGLVTVALAIGGMPVGPTMGGLLRRFGFRSVVAVVTVLSAAACALCAALGTGWSIAAICAVVMAWGLLSELQMNVYNCLAYDDVPSERMPAATVLVYASTRLGQAIGIALAAATVELVPALLGAQVPTSWGFVLAFLMVAGLTLASTPVALRLPAGAGDMLAGRRARDG